MSNAFNLASVSTFGNEMKSETTKKSDLNKSKNRMSTAFSLPSTQQKLEIDQINNFLLGANEVVDENKGSGRRTATNLAPFSKDLGNRFSKISRESQGSFFKANPHA